MAAQPVREKTMKVAANRKFSFNLYAHISRALGLFPVKFGQQGALQFKSLSLPTLYTLSVAALHFASVVDYLYMATLSHQSSKIPLSDMLLLYPSTLAQCACDLVIRLTAIFQCSEFISLTDLLKKQEHLDAFANVNCKSRRPVVELMIYFGLTCNGLNTLVVLTMVAFLHPYENSSLLCGSSSCEHYPLVTALIWLTYVWHDGAILSAALFVSMFGFRLIESFQNFCSCIKTQSLVDSGAERPFHSTLSESSKQVDINSGSIQTSFEGSYAALKNQFEDLKLAFKIFGNISGVFTFALLFEIATILFYAIGQALLVNHETSRSFWQAFLYNFITVILLLSIVEVGNFMATQVSVLHEF